jgi:hypothetical protein
MSYQAVDKFPNLDFDIPDVTHSRQLVLKNALAHSADSEIELVQHLFVTGTDPEASLANFMTNSKRFQELFKEEEQALCLKMLVHLGWSPQRFDSRSKPLGRIATRLEAIFGCLAHEAEGSSSSTRKVWAQKLLMELSQYSRLVIAGLLADLSSLHREWVRQGDTEDPNVEEVNANDRDFRDKLNVLFLQGAIMSEWSLKNVPILFVDSVGSLGPKARGFIFYGTICSRRGSNFSGNSVGTSGFVVWTFRNKQMHTGNDFHQ